MKLFVNLCTVSLALAAEVSFFKDITDLCEESNGAMSCAENSQCKSDGSCIATNSTPVDMYTALVGPVELLDEKVCLCTPGLFGPSCSHSGVSFADKCQDKDYCKNGGEHNWVLQPMSGCC